MKIGTATYDNLIAGDFPTEVQAIEITGEASFKRGDVIGVDDTGVYSLVDSTAADGTQNAIGIICDDIEVLTGEGGVANMYIKGEFNRRYLAFGGTDTADNHKRRMTEIGLIVRETRI